MAYLTTRRRVRHWAWGAAVVLLACATVGRAVSVQIFPSSWRSDRAIRFIGDEVNPVLFILSAQDYGRHKLPDAMRKPTEPVTLVFELPKSIQHLGTIDFYDAEYKKGVRSEAVTREGEPYIRYTVTLKNDILIQRMRRHDYRVKIWTRVPRVAKGAMHWRLLLGKKVIAKSSNPIEIAGTIKAGTPVPRDFILYLWSEDASMTEDIVDKRIALYRKIGVTHLGRSYYPPSKWYIKGLTPRQRDHARRLRNAGIKLTGERLGSFGPARYLQPGGNVQIGLAKGTADCAKSINSAAERGYLANVSDVLDAFTWDYEPSGPDYYKVWETQSTIDAFVKARGIKEPLTPKNIKKKYAKEYYAWCQDLLAEPVRALVKMVRAVNPKMPVFLCQGSGYPTGDHVDLKTYDAVVDYHCPMIYTNPMGFYRKVESTANYIGAKKLVPAVCYGYVRVFTRPLRGALALDYLGVASLGSAGLSHWPGIDYLDGGALYDLYQGARALAPVEVFYRKGKQTQSVIATPLYFVEKKVRVGARVLDLSQPYWKNHLITKAHDYRGETLVTLLNHHPDETAYSRVAARDVRGARYLVCTAEGVYMTVRGKALIPSGALKKGVMVRTRAVGAGLWLLTSDKGRLKGLRALAAEDVGRQYEKRRREFANKKGLAVDLGRKGNLEIAYDVVKDAKSPEDVCLKVTTPSQKLYFTDTGGKIWKWDVGDNDIVRRHGHTGSAVGMDLVWVPTTARWSGDQVRAMELKRCTNSGKDVTLVYASELKTALPGVMIEKTYTVPADGPGVKVAVRYQNDTPIPVTLAYWSHNWFRAPAGNARSLVVVRDGKVLTPPYREKGLSTRVYTNPHMPAAWKQHVMKVDPKAIQPGGRVFGEYFHKSRTGVLFHIPRDYLQIYRWEALTDAGLEWMHGPAKLHTGESVTISYRIQVCADVSMDEFKRLALKQG